MAITPQNITPAQLDGLERGEYPRTNAETLANGRVNELPEIPTIAPITTQVRKLDPTLWPMPKAEPPRHVKALIENMSADELERRLSCGGLEAYSDCNGTMCIRTVEAGNAHREQVRNERQARADEMRRHLIANEKEATERKLDEIDPDWRTTFGDWTTAEYIYRKELAALKPKASRVIHTSAFEPPTFADERRDTTDDDVDFDSDLEDSK